MRNDEKLFRTAVTAIIMILIKVVLSLASHSIYAITLYQPSESDNIYSIDCQVKCNKINEKIYKALRWEYENQGVYGDDY